MKSQTPKVLHSISGRSLLGHVLHALESVEPSTVRVVVGSGREKVEAHLAEIAPDAIAVFQAERNGTGHAVQVALNGVNESGNVLILAGDTPMLSGQTLKEFVEAHNAGGYTASVLTAEQPDPTGYGRIIRDDQNLLLKIVEEKDATEDEKVIFEINSGVYMFDFVALTGAIAKLKSNNAQGELYLTDAIEIIRKEGGKVDVEINVLNDQGESTRKMEQVKLSVKLSSSLIGQKARGKTAQEVYTNLQELFEPLSVDLESVKKQIINLAEKSGVENQFADAVTLAYKTAYEQLRSLTTNRAEDIVLVQRLGKFLDYHATQHDPEIQVIQLDSSGTYKILSYRKLDRVMRDESINIAVRMNEGSSDKYPGYSFPNITFYDSNVKGAKGIMMEIRYRTRGTYANHIVQPGPVLKELATYRRYKSGKPD